MKLRNMIDTFDRANFAATGTSDNKNTTGQGLVFTSFGPGAAATWPRIENGKLKEAYPGNTDANEWDVDLTFTPGRVELTWSYDSFTSPVDTTVPWLAPISSSRDGNFDVYVHPLFYRDSMIFSVSYRRLDCTTSSTITGLLINHAYAAPLSAGVQHSASVEYNNNTVIMTDPFGATATVSHPQLANSNGRFMNLQINYHDADGVGPLNVHRFACYPKKRNSV